MSLALAEPMAVTALARLGAVAPSSQNKDLDLLPLLVALAVAGELATPEIMAALVAMGLVVPAPLAAAGVARAARQQPEPPELTLLALHGA